MSHTEKGVRLVPGEAKRIERGEIERALVGRRVSMRLCGTVIGSKLGQLKLGQNPQVGTIFFAF